MVRPRWSTIEQGFARGTRVDAPDIHHLQYAQDVWWCFHILQTSKIGDEVQDKVCMLWNCSKLQPFHHRTAITSKPRWNWRCPNSQKVGVKSRGIGLDCSHLFHFILIILFFLLWRSTRIYMLWWAGTSRLWERNCSTWKPEPAAELLNFLN